MLFKDAPIQRKLMAVILLTTGVALVFSGFGFISYEVLTVRKNMALALDTRAEIMAVNLPATLAQRDAKSATEMLNKLQMDRRMASACLYDGAGRIFARYPADAPDAFFPAAPGEPGHRFGTTFLSTFYPVIKDGRTLGILYLKSNLSALTQRFPGYAIVSSIIFFCSLLAAWLLSKILGRQISQPIRSLAETAKIVSDHRDFSVRAARQGRDELGLLTDTFNEMLARIQEQNQNLQRFAAIVESSEDAIIGKTLAGVITSWNPGAEKLLGYSAREAIGRPMLTFIPSERVQEEPEILARIARGESIEHFETVRVRKDGQRLDVSVAISPIRDADARVVGASTIARDISERKRAQAEILQLNAELELRVAKRTAELEAANKELEAFSYSVSHDLRAPLRAVSGFAAIVIEEYSPLLPAEARHYLERVRNGGQRMGELIDDLLAFSRLSRQPLNRQPVDMAALVREVVAEVNSAASLRRIEFHLGELPTCPGDPALLKQVWINLISNAVKYTRGRAPAVVAAGCEHQNGEDIFFVRDNGVGFDMQYAKKLFGVFQRLHRADEFEGTGVGLAIVQRVIHRHGGRVWAEAQPDRGATFYFTLEGENHD